MVTKHPHSKQDTTPLEIASRVTGSLIADVAAFGLDKGHGRPARVVPSATERTPPGNQGSELSLICGPVIVPLSGLPSKRRKTLRDFSIE